MSAIKVEMVPFSCDPRTQVDRRRFRSNEWKEDWFRRRRSQEKGLCNPERDLRTSSHFRDRLWGVGHYCWGRRCRLRPVGRPDASRRRVPYGVGDIWFMIMAMIECLMRKWKNIFMLANTLRTETQEITCHVPLAFHIYDDLAMKSRRPATTLPTGAPKPLLRHRLTLSQSSTISRTLIPKRADALNIRAPSQWSGSPWERQTWAT